MIRRIGMLTPSSNTALEPATYRLLRHMPDVTAHFARFPVTEIALSPTALGQFDPESIMQAADLLAHAKVDAIAWNGTSASWLGFERDTQLANAIEKRTIRHHAGIHATTAILAINAIFQRLQARRIALVTPYIADVQQRIVGNYTGAGYACVGERHAGLQDNFSFCAIPTSEIEAMILAVATEKPDAIAVVCTNMDAADLAPRIELEIGIPVIDSIAATLWGALDVLAMDKTPLRDCGRLFRF
ncbi:aspartate/glutamate racemase family protein [Ferrovibrio sp.]|uniref:maleate cis-trans isomerase family protein n=1 Tax=Ferrovibrio sp. TaxID=1917215 RepID=UPI0025BDCAEF|nr:aspartate/glutamate racemase family protein [Ferrovibrio sp.]MBX3456720.1 Asp/Glu/hydantoin racemase [Ferrovibrio sp.]